MVVLLPRPNFVSTCLDKYTLMRTLDEAGIGVPRTWSADEWPVGAVDSAPGGFIVKPRSGRGSRGVVCIESAQDMARVVAESGYATDELLVQRTPRLAGVMTDYERVLKQRNSLLKSARARGLAAAQLPTLDIWDERLVALGAELIDRRLELIDELREPVAAAYRSIVDADHAPELRPVLSGLPVAGFTGSLEFRFADAPPASRGRVRAKTGTLTGTSALAGVATDLDGTSVAFMLVADRVPKPQTLAARDALDDAAAALAGCHCSVGSRS